MVAGITFGLSILVWTLFWTIFWAWRVSSFLFVVGVILGVSSCTATIFSLHLIFFVKDIILPFFKNNFFIALFLNVFGIYFP